MNQNESKRSMIEQNIRAIQQRIHALESSFQETTPDLIEEIPAEPVYPIQRVSNRDFSAQDSKINRTDRKGAQNQSYRSKAKMGMSRHEPENYEFEADPSQKVIEELLREIDALKQKSNQQELKIETMNFRCDKLQNELSLKLDVINKQNIEIEERSTQLKNSQNQVRSLESQLDQQKKTTLPQLQKIKGQYDICLLEIKSLENDNSILDDRIRQLNEANIGLRNENRELRNNNSKIEMERLTLKKEIEELKTKFFANEDEIEDISLKFDELSMENERLKNELTVVNQKLTVLNADKANRVVVDQNDRNSDEAVIKITRDIGNLQGRFDTTYISNGLKENEETLNMISTKRNGTEAKTGAGRSFLPPTERLNFDSINGVEEKFKRLVQH